jgi:hypothetical protein
VIRFRIDHQALTFRVRYEKGDAFRQINSCLSRITSDGVVLELVIPPGLKLDARAWRGAEKEPGWWGTT